jgi:hypothetical protein
LRPGQFKLSAAVNKGQNALQDYSCRGVLHIRGHAIRPAIVPPRPHQAASQVRTHCLLEGRYSRKTVVSRIKFPPPPNPIMATKKASEFQVGAAPAQIPEIEQMKSEMLNA